VGEPRACGAHNFQGKGSIDERHRVRRRADRQSILLVWVSEQGAFLEVRLRRMRRSDPYRSPSGKERFRDLMRAAEIPRLDRALESREARPNLPFKELNEHQVDRLLAACDEWCHTVREHHVESGGAGEDEAEAEDAD
jgi:hypothetical protein